MQAALDNGLTDELVEKLCDKLSPALTTEKLPLLSVEQQRELVEIAIRIILSRECRPLGIVAVQEASEGLGIILNERSRAALIEEINAKIDLPFLNEEQQSKIIGGVLDGVSSTIQTVIPSEFLDILSGSSPVEIEAFKELVVDRVMSVIPPIPPFTEEQNTAMVAAVVSVLFEALAEGSAVHEAAASLSTEGRIKFLRQKEERLVAGNTIGNKYNEFSRFPYIYIYIYMHVCIHTVKFLSFIMIKKLMN